MEKFRVTREEKDLLEVELFYKKTLVSYIIRNDSREKTRWKFFVRCSNKNEMIYNNWEKVKIENGEIVSFYDGEKVTYSKQKNQEMIEAFHELIKQLKHHPKYRLKLINTLAGNMKEIWERI